jgi:hypothetical protein
MSVNCGQQQAYCFPPGDILWVWRDMVEWYWQQKIRTLRQTCLSATLSTTNPIWTDLGSSLGLRGERLVTNHLSHCMVQSVMKCSKALLIQIPLSWTSLNRDYKCNLYFCIGSVTCTRITDPWLSSSLPPCPIFGMCCMCISTTVC